MDSNPKRANWLWGLAGAFVGGLLGYMVFAWLARQGFYALALPGAALGLGCGTVSRGKSDGLATICAVAGVLLALVGEWQVAPFVVDRSFLYFVTHLHHVRIIALVAIALSGVVAYWLARGHEQRQ